MAVPENRLTPQQRERRTVRRRALADALIMARREAGLTQTELAEAAGMSRSAIARLENSTASIASDALWDIAVALGMRPSQLFAAAEADAAARDTLDGV
ncbi:helix-turn-helix domain-containing protein [Gordonia sp. SND2]|uniref:helix-turn-helix domain-containing protein n=1 Tax=Gordonia sp. SND2 TaxID=3388659 RepID=UPI00398AB4A5